MLKSKVEDINYYSKKTFRIREKLIDFSTPLIMGIINCTPDSFYFKSRAISISEVLNHVEKQIHDGVDIIDFGAYSSRPGAIEIDVQTEIDRLIPIIVEVRKKFPELIISIDTFRGKIAEIALNSGADIINDIGAFELDPKMLEVLGKHKCPYILMHSKGNPQTMQNFTNYDSLFKELAHFFSEKISILLENGINDIIIDPGFGFSKTLDQNYEILNNLAFFNFLNFPILVGLSRKSMIYNKLNISPQEALNGTSILNTFAIQKNASILRVHDVKEAKQIVDLFYNELVD